MNIAESSSNEQVIRHLSPSSASTFRQCPRRWKFRYIDHLPDPKGVPALLGTFVHRILEELMLVSASERTNQFARNIAREIWPEVADDPDFKALLLDDEGTRAFRWQAWNLMESYFEMEDPQQVDVLAAEQRLEVDLMGVPFLGIVDRTERIENGLRVTDFKTGKAPQNRYLDDKLSQVWLYAAALEAVDQPVSEVRLMYLTGKFIDRKLDDAAVENAVNRHFLTWKSIGNCISDSRFDYKLGPLCNWCPYTDSCPQGLAEAERRYGPRF